MYSSSESDAETPEVLAAAAAPAASTTAAAAVAPPPPTLLQAPRPANQSKPSQRSEGQYNSKAAARPNDDGMVDPTKVLRPKRYSSTLLERLLAKEVKHERNVVLQCIRHIVRQKYFGLG